MPCSCGSSSHSLGCSGSGCGELVLGPSGPDAKWSSSFDCHELAVDFIVYQFVLDQFLRVELATMMSVRVLCGAVNKERQFESLPNRDQSDFLFSSSLLEVPDCNQGQGRRSEQVCPEQGICSAKGRDPGVENREFERFPGRPRGGAAAEGARARQFRQLALHREAESSLRAGAASTGGFRRCGGAASTGGFRRCGGAAASGGFRRCGGAAASGGFRRCGGAASTGGFRRCGGAASSGGFRRCGGAASSGGFRRCGGAASTGGFRRCGGAAASGGFRRCGGAASTVNLQQILGKINICMEENAVIPEKISNLEKKYNHLFIFFSYGFTLNTSTFLLFSVDFGKRKGH
ncbi:uncharacterized protein [Dasypus novemcinctus]|uniref:uncharacterized protein n=1 Tax=Dasypus novemcinctus TaxID=9361 RepID=UPI0039C91993